MILFSVILSFGDYCYKMWNSFMMATGLDSATESEEDVAKGVSKQWTEDYKLLDWGDRGLFSEYLEMVMQYGFVTIFVSAFPLAPVFALLNNVFEMRLDAKKFLTFYRRPIPRRAPNIGVWFRILDVLGKLAVISNAFIIAFSSNFIPRLVYMATMGPDHTDEGFLNNSLSYFDTADFPPGTAPRNPSFNVTMCRYAAYRNPPHVSPKYKRTVLHWHILAARLAFIVVFQNVVSLVMIAVQWCIPDMSPKLRDQIKREAYLTSEIIIKQETLRARGNFNDDAPVNPRSMAYSDAEIAGPRKRRTDKIELEDIDTKV